MRGLRMLSTKLKDRGFPDGAVRKTRLHFPTSHTPFPERRKLLRGCVLTRQQCVLVTGSISALETVFRSLASSSKPSVFSTQQQCCCQGRKCSLNLAHFTPLITLIWIVLSHPCWEIYWNLVAPQPANNTFETHEKPTLATATHCCLSGAGPDVGDRGEEESSSHSLGDLVWRRRMVVPLLVFFSSTQDGGQVCRRGEGTANRPQVLT